ncbi:MAG: hypothetical protein PF495_05505 [Spirochaetales bacterium]|jgi:phosphoserine phosphatase|nr:hypothetical protein [Spirochaetales bacterium]
MNKRKSNNIFAPKQTKDVPLIVDLDGTILASDLLLVSLRKLLNTSFLTLFKLPFWLIRGKSALKAEIAKRVNLDVRNLPYNTKVITWLNTEKKEGRTLILSTASNEKYARQIAEHLGIFDSVQASNYDINLSSHTKRDLNVKLFGEGGFDYIGNSMDDLPVWASAAKAFIVNPSPRVLRAAKVSAKISKIF